MNTISIPDGNITIRAFRTRPFRRTQTEVRNLDSGPTYLRFGIVRLIFRKYGTSETNSELWALFKIRNCETYFSEVWDSLVAAQLSRSGRSILYIVHVTCNVVFRLLHACCSNVGLGFFLNCSFLASRQHCKFQGRSRKVHPLYSFSTST
jgi:hypothetical protein